MLAIGIDTTPPPVVDHLVRQRGLGDEGEGNHPLPKGRQSRVGPADGAGDGGYGEGLVRWWADPVTVGIEILPRRAQIALVMSSEMRREEGIDLGVRRLDATYLPVAGEEVDPQRGAGVLERNTPRLPFDPIGAARSVADHLKAFRQGYCELEAHLALSGARIPPGVGREPDARMREPGMLGPGRWPTVPYQARLRGPFWMQHGSLATEPLGGPVLERHLGKLKSRAQA